jgi:predicted acetyltransferase
MAIELRLLDASEHAHFLTPLRSAFGLVIDADRITRARRLEEISERIGAFEGDLIVGCAGAYAMTMTTPGGSVPVSGLTMVGVASTHRRRGVLTTMIRRHFDRARAEGKPISALWSAEPAIYGRFGYGIASSCGAIAVERARSAFRRPSAEGELALLDEREALAPFAEVWDRVRADTPGMMSRTPAWWEVRRLGDHEKSGPPLQRLLVRFDGRAEGYALYRFANRFDPIGTPEANLQVVEALGATPRATARVWRYLFDVDLARRIEATLIPPDHALFHLLRDPRALRLMLTDGLWLRLLDVEAALAARAFAGDEEVTLGVDDALFPENTGSYRVGGGRVVRVEGGAELRLDVAALGSTYLGSVSFASLAAAGEVEEVVAGAIARADRIFRAGRGAWCPEIF